VRFLKLTCATHNEYDTDMEKAAYYLIKAAIGPRSVYFPSKFRESVLAIRPIVEAAKRRGGFTDEEAGLVNAHTRTLINEWKDRKGWGGNVSLRPDNPHTLGGRIDVKNAPSSLDFAVNLPAVEDTKAWMMPLLAPKHESYYGAKGTGAGSTLVRRLNRVYQAAGFDAAHLNPTSGGGKTWGKPRFGFNAKGGAGTIMKFTPGEPVDTGDLLRVFNPDVRKALESGKNIEPADVMTNIPQWWKDQEARRLTYKAQQQAKPQPAAKPAAPAPAPPPKPPKVSKPAAPKPAAPKPAAPPPPPPPPPPKPAPPAPPAVGHTEKPIPAHLDPTGSIAAIKKDWREALERANKEQAANELKRKTEYAARQAKQQELPKAPMSGKKVITLAGLGLAGAGVGGYLLYRMHKKRKEREAQATSGLTNS